ncbi:MAG: T9SS type A sorting domain-containing protein [Methanococcaceae archaeon]
MRTLISFLLLFVSVCFSQSEIYVSTSGNDNNNGSMEYPFRSIQRAVDEAQTISFSIANKEKVVVKIYNIIGQEVLKILDETLEAGTYEHIFNAGKLSSGIYFYQLTAGQFSEIKKMQVLK